MLSGSMRTNQGLLFHTHDQEATMQILDRIEPKIKASLQQVPADHREDLKQELYVKMIELYNVLI